MDSAAFLTVVTGLVALIFIAIGIYLILLIREAHQSLKRVNKILTRVDHLSNFIEHSIARPTAGFANIAGLVHDGITLINDLRRTTHPRKESEGIHE